MTMTVICVVAGVALALWTGFADGLAAPAPGSARPEDERAIRAHIDSIFEAYATKDRERLRATHSKDWRGFIRVSRDVIRGIDEYMRDAEAVFAGGADFVSHEMREFDALFYGPLAIVSYTADIGWRRGGTASSDTLRVLDVYAKFPGGEWNQIASNVATHPDAIAAYRQNPRTLAADERKALLADREAVWRAFFAGDRATLEALLPTETIALNAGAGPWQDREAVLASSTSFAASGSRCVALEFPRTEMQVYGDVAILMTTYRFVVEAKDASRTTHEGRGTETFVRRGGRWLNTAWHLDDVREAAAEAR